MKKLILLSMLIVGLFLVSCAKDNLPPEPGAPGTSGGGALAGQATGEEWCTGTVEGVTFDLTPQELVVEEGGSGLIQTELIAPLVYDICYYFADPDWVLIDLVGPRVLNNDGTESNWIDETASGEEMIPADVLSVLTEDGGVVACYSCIWNDMQEEYDCCGDRWMPRTFGVEITPAACVGDIDCLPDVCDVQTGQCVECITSSDCGEKQVCSAGVCGGRGLPTEPEAPSFLIPETGTDEDDAGTTPAGMGVCEDSDLGLIIVEGQNYDINQLVGDSIYQQGTLTDSYGNIHSDCCIQSVNDECSNEVNSGAYVSEGICYQWTGQSEIESYSLPLECPYGFGCVDGACQAVTAEELACEDSDGPEQLIPYDDWSQYTITTLGELPAVADQMFEKGTVTNQGNVLSDNCYSSEELDEYICIEEDGRQLWKIAYLTCPDGFSCLDGACVQD